MNSFSYRTCFSRASGAGTLALLLCTGALSGCDAIWAADETPPPVYGPPASPARAAQPEKQGHASNTPASAPAVQDEEVEVSDKPDPNEIPAWYSLENIAPENPVGEIRPQPLAANPEMLKAGVEHGKYLVRSVAACGVCHGSKNMDPGAPLAGGREIVDSDGLVRAPNITPDRETGIGTWAVADIVSAVRASIGKDERPLSIDVHWAYRWMSDKDAEAIALYLLSRKPVKNELERRDLGLFNRKKLGLITRHRPVQGYVPQGASNQPLPQWGRYLTQHVAACGHCHTSERAQFADAESLDGNDARSTGTLLGSAVSLAKVVVSPVLSEDEGREAATDQVSGELIVPPGAPNIRSKDGGGLSSWKADQIVEFLDTGRTAAGKQVYNCPWKFYNGMSSREKQAIANYLKSI